MFDWEDGFHKIFWGTEDSELAEAEANFFAKFALAPPILIHKLNLKTVKEIAERFAISYEAAQYALNFYYKRYREKQNRCCWYSWLYKKSRR